MKSAIKIICGFLAVLLLSALASYSVVSMDIESVENFSVKERGNTYQTLCWKSNKKADAYKVYQKNADSAEYTLIKTIESGEITECRIDGLDMETYYTFKISAVKLLFGFEKESDLSKPLNTCTLPRGEDFKEVSVDGTTIKVIWSKGLNCDGYEIDYALNADFSDKRTITLNSMTNTMCKIEGLTLGKTYCLRMRSFMNFDGKILYSEYCQTIKATVKKQVSEADIDPDKPVIALSFDDGPDMNGSSKKILDVLEKYNARATFFTVGENAEYNPENLKRKVQLGCEIGNHTYNHKHYGKDVTASDIIKCSDVIEEIIGIRPTVFRATGGITTSEIKKVCKQEGMSLYYWTIDTEDWKSRNTNKILKEALKAKDGDIILMHDIYPETAKAVKKLIPKLQKKGFQFVTVSELVKIKTGEFPKNGIQYVSGSQIKSN